MAMCLDLGVSRGGSVVCQQLAGSVVLEHGAYGGDSITISEIELAADFLQQSSHVNKAAHPSREGNVFALRGAECY